MITRIHNPCAERVKRKRIRGLKILPLPKKSEDISILDLIRSEKSEQDQISKQNGLFSVFLLAWWYEVMKVFNFKLRFSEKLTTILESNWSFVIFCINSDWLKYLLISDLNFFFRTNFFCLKTHNFFWSKIF